MKRAIAIVVAVTVAVVALAVITFSGMLRRGFSAHDEPSAMEAMMARRMRAWAVPSDLRNEKNPVPLTPPILAEARAHFADHCATCHGNDGKGSDLGKRMYPPAPDMTNERTQGLSDGALFAVIENGIRLSGMPAFGTGTAESAYGSWSLVHFVRHLPQITPAELEEMRRLNPAPPTAAASPEAAPAAPAGHGAHVH